MFEYILGLVFRFCRLFSLAHISRPAGHRFTTYYLPIYLLHLNYRPSLSRPPITGLPFGKRLWPRGWAGQGMGWADITQMAVDGSCLHTRARSEMDDDDDDEAGTTEPTAERSPRRRGRELREPAAERRRGGAGQLRNQLQSGDEEEEPGNCGTSCRAATRRKRALRNQLRSGRHGDGDGALVLPRGYVPLPAGRGGQRERKGGGRAAWGEGCLPMDLFSCLLVFLVIMVFGRRR